MQNNGFMRTIYKFSEWVFNLAYLNLLWITFSILGILFIGFFPATFAMFAVVPLLLDKEDVSIFKSFWIYFKKDLLQSNILGWGILIISIIFYFDIQIVRTTCRE